jgi:PAS domain S-box-containing protein
MIKKYSVKHAYSYLLHYILLILVFIFLPLHEGRSQSYLVHHYSEINGLPTSVVYDVTQDSTGRMWFATRRGISVYNGIQWTTFTASDNLPVPSYYKIIADSKDRIWALSNAGQKGVYVVFYDGRSWHRLPELPQQVNEHLGLTSLALLEKYTSDGQQIIVAVGTMTHGLFLWQDNKWNQFSARNNKFRDNVSGVVTIENKFYVTTDNGIYILDENGIDDHLNHELRRNLPIKETDPIDIKTVHLQKKDRLPDIPLKYHCLWISGDDWLGFFENGHFKLVLKQKELSFGVPPREGHVGLLPDYRNGIYISHYIKTYYYNLKDHTLSPLDVTNGLIGEGANSMFIDFEKNIWISCFRGVSKLVSRRFGSFNMRHGLLQDEVTAIAEYDTGKYVFGHNNGLTFYDGKKFERLEFPIAENRDVILLRILEINVDSRKNIWVTAANAPLLKVTPQKKLVYYDDKNGILPFATCTWIDPDDTVWVGTMEGLFKKEGKRFTYIDMPNFPRPYIRKIFRTPNGTIYLASVKNGVYRYRNGQWDRVKHPIIRGANKVYAIHSYDNHILLGTQAGLFLLKNKVMEPFEENDFRIDRPVYFITRDHRRMWWFGGENGVIRWDGKKSRHYSVPDGLIGQETNRAAGLVDSRGQIWIGTNRGVSVYNHDFDTQESETVPPPRVHLTELQVANKRIPLKGNTPIYLAPGEHSLIFYFRAVSFIDEKKVKFKTQLEGFEKKWFLQSYPHMPIARYPNLEPGRYRFHLMARNAIGVWSDIISSQEIIIQKPYYQQWWFFLLGILLASSLLAGIYRLYAERRYASLLKKQVEERTHQLQITEEKYSTLFKESKDMVFISTPGGKFLDINPAGIELFGYRTKEEILAINIGNQLYAKQQDRIRFQNEIAQKGYVKDYQLNVKRKDNKDLVVLLTVTAVTDENGKIYAYRGIIRDITNKKELEHHLERVQKMEAIGTLVGGVAHDLNNILSGLTSYPELLLSRIPDDSPLRRPLNTIKRTGEKAAAVVQDLLTLARRGVAVSDIVSLTHIVKDYMSSPECRKLHSYSPDTVFEVKTDAELLNVKGSPIHLFKTLMNLVSNAVEAMPEGGRVTIMTRNETLETPRTTYETIPAGKYVVLTVADTGTGISEDDIPRIFEPFYTRKKMGRSGTGLGMSVVWATVKDHRGFIDIRSQQGKGTVFELYFPSTTEKRISKEDAVSIERYKGHEHILLIDDVEEQREVASEILQNLGYKVHAVRSGEEAVKHMAEYHDTIDLLVIDMILEYGIDGLETYRRIIDEFPGQKAIIVSGFSETDEVKELQRLGAGTYIRKPYSIEQLGCAVREELDNNPKE